MERILLLIVIILPFVLVMLWFIKNRNAKGYIEESGFTKISSKEKFIQALERLCKDNKWKLDIEEGKVLIRTNITIYSLGEIIAITFEEKDDGLFVEVSSKPKVKTTRIDYNKNKNNVALITGLASE